MNIRFVSPWYPDYTVVHSGIFVAKQVEALRERGNSVTIEVPQIFPAPPGPVPEVVLDAMRALATSSFEAMFAVDDGVTYVPTPVPSRGGLLGRANAMAQSLSLLHEFRSDRADIVHAHVGMPTGWAAADVDPDIPLVVTEHWSGLSAVFGDPMVSEAYSNLIRRSKAFICVSPHLRDQIVEAVGSWAEEQIVIIPNIVDLTDIPFSARNRFSCRSWIYVGGLMPHKGIQDLLRSFELYVRKHDPVARMTLVGEGPLRGWVETFSASRGIADQVTLAGSVEHAGLSRYMNQADVMVHLSPAETFGIAPLEAIGAGIPVVSLRNLGAVGTWGDIEAECGALLDLETTPAGVADAVAQLRDSPEQLDLRAGRQAIEDRYSSAVVATQLVSVYQDALR